MIPTENADFWRAMLSVGQEVLDQAGNVGFGMSDVSIKYADNKPVIVVRSHAENRKYKDSDQAIRDIVALMQHDIESGFNGTRSFTPVYDYGKIRRVIIDDYRNIAL